MSEIVETNDIEKEKGATTKSSRRSKRKEAQTCNT
jgi:hypothetical protein